MQSNRFRGCLLGLAAGDALGTTLEFTRSGSFEPLEDMVGGGPFSLQPGQWTDDTSMALCLAESLIEKQGFDPADQMARYLRWWQSGHLSSTGICFDIGNTVRSALLRYQASGEPYAGSTDPYTAGNGSLMRLAPVVLFFAAEPVKAVYFAGESSRTTHCAASAVDACRYFAGLLLGALQGASRDELLEGIYEPYPGCWQEQPLDPDIARVAGGSFRQRNPPEVRGSGYVVESLEAALWAFQHSNTFRSGALMAANLGEDADTTTAIYGQIAGAYYGFQGIPADWLDKLAFRKQIQEMADRLFELSGVELNG